MLVLIFNFIAINISYVYEHLDTKPLFTSKILLNKLVGSVSSNEDVAYKQKRGFMFYDTIFPESIIHIHHKILKIVHFTSRTRYLSKCFYDNLQKWQLSNHSVYLYGKDTMYRLMFKKWDLFPHLQEVIKCVGSSMEKVRYMSISK